MSTTFIWKVAGEIPPATLTDNTIPGVHLVRGEITASCGACERFKWDPYVCGASVEELQEAELKFAMVSPEIAKDKYIVVRCDLFKSTAIRQLRELSGRPDATTFWHEPGLTLEGLAAAVKSVEIEGKHPHLRLAWRDGADGSREWADEVSGRVWLRVK